MPCRAFRFVPSLLALCVAALLALPAAAQKKKSEPDAAAEEIDLDEDTSGEGSAEGEGGETSEGEEGQGEGEEGEGEGEKGDEGGGAADDGADKSSPVEVTGQTYHFVGARYRLLLIPEFIMGLFGQGGTTLAVHSFGPEFAIRKDGFEYAFALTYAPYTMDQIAFKAPDDPEFAWEVVDSELKVLYLTADFVWSTPVGEQVSFIYGGGGGLGLVFGDLYRTQAYLDNGVYRPCAGHLNPMNRPSPEGMEYCANDPEHDPQHFPGYTEPSWADGGSKPIIFPWLAIQAGIRWKPHRNFVGRLEMGIGLGQVFFGVGADYGL